MLAKGLKFIETPVTNENDDKNNGGKVKLPERKSQPL